MRTTLRPKLARRAAFAKVTLVASLSVFAVLAELANPHTVAAQDASAPTLPRPLVSVVQREAQPEAVQFTVFGAVSAHYQQKLTSEVTGRVLRLSKQLEPGLALKKGDVLAEIEDSSYRAALATAEESVASSELSLLQEEQRGKQAELDWQRANIKGREASPLVLRQPFLKLEQLKLKAAEANLVEAQRNLQNTQIAAPFDAVVISRSVAPSSYITAGTEVAEIYSTDALEVEVSLTPVQWQLLLTENGSSLDVNDISVQVLNGAGVPWPARITSVGPIANAQTRQQSLRLQVEPRNAQGTVMRPGTFVSVVLTGRKIPDVVMVPASAITSQGYVWTVSRDSKLERHAVSPLFTRGDDVALDVNAFPAHGAWEIVVNPISRYLPQQIVTTQPAE
ncbi:efflux RND transporter periplasmic adaptor subunit [Pseudovibrio denitrificans]|uniref:efflux RND transporter periplasmic adaptor subunit n=1 Tax=Pseudovibrio denitrificans TaxID=258256 RepID=UPI0039BEF31F